VFGKGPPDYDRMLVKRVGVLTVNCQFT